MTTENASMAFPEDVWGIIFGEMDDSTDILKVMKAFPELEARFKKKMPFWLFDQVIPHLSLWLTTNELLNCRQSCKRWCRGVDNFLENHSAPFEQQRNLIRSCFTRPEQFTEFRRDMKHRPMSANRSPFVGRAIKLAQVRCYTENGTEDEMQRKTDAESHVARFWNSAVDFLREFGGNIWFIEICPSERQRYSDFKSSTSNCLPHLPNLKHLLISATTLFAVDGREGRESIPHLPQLKTVTIKTISPPNGWDSGDYFLYYRQLRRALSMIIPWRRTPAYSMLLPSLTLVSVVGTASPLDLMSICIRTKTQNLTSFKLNVQNCFMDASSSSRVTNVILQLLEDFHGIRHLKLQGPKPSTGDSKRRNRRGIIFENLNYHNYALRSLVLTDDYYCDYHFLRKFPMLECIRIYGWKFYPEDYIDKRRVLRGYFNDLMDSRSHSNSKIWESFRNLKIVVMSKCYDAGIRPSEGKGSERRFTRDDFEFGKKNFASGFSRNLLRIGYKK